jgi:hypothetical protein
MRKTFVGVVLILVVFAVLLPFASSSPDGLQSLISSSGVQQQGSSWNGLLSGYSVAFVENPYVSTLLAGFFGVVVVLAATFVLGSVVAPKKKNETTKET